MLDKVGEADLGEEVGKSDEEMDKGGGEAGKGGEDVGMIDRDTVESQWFRTGLSRLEMLVRLSGVKCQLLGVTHS